jgi:hypothetical protein
MSSHREERVAATPEHARATGSAAPPGDTSRGETGDGRGGPATEQRSSTGEQRSSATTSRTDRAGNMLPGRARRRFGIERLLVRLVATCGIVAIGVALGAILVSSSVQGWIIGLVISCVSVVLAGMLWSSRQL